MIHPKICKIPALQYDQQRRFNRDNAFRIEADTGRFSKHWTAWLGRRIRILKW
jgi:hypothetical protein